MPIGPKGPKGWSPVLAVVPDPDDESRAVLQITGWTGGEGQVPTVYIGWYLSTTGPVNNIPAAENVKGPEGPVGQQGPVGGLEAFLAVSVPTSVPVHDDSVASIADGTTQEITALAYNTLTGYDTVTGIWTCPENGVYGITGNVVLTKPGEGWISGHVSAGIVIEESGNSPRIFAGNTFYIDEQSVVKEVAISAAIDVVPLVAGNTVRLNVVNKSLAAYTSSGADKAMLSIRKTI
jgi:hypothetical protein